MRNQQQQREWHRGRFDHGVHDSPVHKGGFDCPRSPKGRSGGSAKNSEEGNRWGSATISVEIERSRGIRGDVCGHRTQRCENHRDTAGDCNSVRRRLIMTRETGREGNPAERRLSAGFPDTCHGARAERLKRMRLRGFNGLGHKPDRRGQQQDGDDRDREFQQSSQNFLPDARFRIKVRTPVLSGTDR